MSVRAAFNAGSAALLFLVVSTGCGGARPEGDAIVVAIANSPVNLDPRIGADEASQKAHQLLYNTLVRVDADLSIVPELITEPLQQPDAVTYVATLRKGVTFHNGRELTSEDVVYTFRSFLDPSFRGRSGAYRVLASVSALDRYSVEFKLKEPFASFPINLVMGIVQAGSGTANVRNPIGTGPYRMQRFVQDDRLVLEPFEGYHGGRPANDGVVLKVVPDDTMRGLELRKGTVDLVVNDLAPDIVWQLKSEGRLGIAMADGSDYAYMGLNLKDQVLRHVDVRRAIGYAIDRAAIVQYLRRGFARVAVGIIPPMSWAFEKDVFDFTYDPEQARRLLDAAGYPGSRRSWSAAPLSGVAEDVDLGGVSRPGRRDPARPREGGDCRGRPVERTAGIVRGRRCAAATSCTRCNGSASPILTCCAASTIRGRLRPRGSTASSTPTLTSTG